MTKPEKVVRVKSWSELPETLEPGVYYVDGERHTIKARVRREDLLKALRRASRKGARI
ncbi:MAG: hypothetical protein GSR85_00135 [Desulfurococcales archaeon]|nr:hypothetical protein [Desulfurococcales archaeon]